MGGVGYHNNNNNKRFISVVKYNDRHTNIILMNHDGRYPSLILMIHFHNVHSESVYILSVVVIQEFGKIWYWRIFKSACSCVRLDVLVFGSIGGSSRFANFTFFKPVLESRMSRSLESKFQT